jgi:hypothetical protein
MSSRHLAAIVWPIENARCRLRDQNMKVLRRMINIFELSWPHWSFINISIGTTKAQRHAALIQALIGIVTMGCGKTNLTKADPGLSDIPYVSWHTKVYETLATLNEGWKLDSSIEKIPK